MVASLEVTFGCPMPMAGYNGGLGSPVRIVLPMFCMWKVSDLIFAPSNAKTFRKQGSKTPLLAVLKNYC